MSEANTDLRPVPPRLVQVAMCTAILTRTVQLFTQVFGFADARGEILWGPAIAQMQGLEGNVSCFVWWLVGRQSFMQVELFQHFLPEQRPQPADWRPSDHGWVRWGIAVPDFDAVVAKLDRFGLATLTPPMTFGDGVRRVCIRDPDVGAIIEIMEDGPTIPGGPRPRHFDLGPSVVYATVSVPDLGEARNFWAGVMELETVPSETLHTAEMEGLWGLAGADREVLLVKAGDCFVEIVEYRDPAGRPRRPDARSSDQGMMNVAVGFRERAPLDRLLARLEAVGSRPATPIGPGQPAASYFRAPDGTPFEILSIDASYDHQIGFVPRPNNPVQGILDAIAV